MGRHSVKPGITGWAQVRHRYAASVEDSMEKLQYDLYYIKNLSPLLDLVILLSTLQVVSVRARVPLSFPLKSIAGTPAFTAV